jgi:hypothetical protein
MTSLLPPTLVGHLLQAEAVASPLTVSWLWQSEPWRHGIYGVVALLAWKGTLGDGEWKRCLFSATPSNIMFAYLLIM